MSAAEPRNAALDLPSRLGTLYQPILPWLKRIKVVRAGRREHRPSDILLPRGFVAELVAGGLTAPVHACFGPDGSCYVTESGHKSDSPPRVVRIDPHTGAHSIFFEFPLERWVKTGAATGACWHQGYLYVTNTDTLSRIGPDGNLEDVVTDLPGKGDHQVNYPVVGPDGKLYFGVGSATNAGVVGADNFAYEWLPKFPGFCDVPGADVTLAGTNFEFRNVLGSVAETVRSGAYVPFGTPTEPGQRIPGRVKCSGSVLRCDPDGSHLEVVAWGLRNPYGVAFHPDGRLFATEHGMDERGARYIVGDYDDLYEIKPGEWYGWPDFASGIPLTDPSWGSGGQGREPILASHPTGHPPLPVVTFEPHVGANGLDFSASSEFGFPGQAFVALFGDLAPVTTPRLAAPVGFKVVRVDPDHQRVVNFAVNKLAGPASKLPHDGFERPSHCVFGPDHTLYVVDFGEIQIAPERGGVRVMAGTGTLWRIRRVDHTTGELPPTAVEPPLYLIQVLGGLLGLVTLAGLVALIVRRLRRKPAAGQR